MDPIKNIVDLLNQLELSEIKKYSLIYLFSVLLVLGGLEFYFILKQKNIKEMTEKLIEKRKLIVKNIQNKVNAEAIKKRIDSILNDDSFRLKDYLYLVIKNDKYSKYVSSDNELINEQLNKPGYMEVFMTFEMKGMSTKEIFEMLSLIEQEERVYVKEIALKRNENKTISISVTIATIKIVQTS